ncbi:MAG TPA: glycerophosphodiester phosphodiesterase family protein [Nocardioidaceae bacterium]|nr:glycerophosphodiester phosphodiesterase family protein [Nocardioidaceae bacterium]
MGTQRARLDLQAHRGGLGLTVENTLEAFATALDLGVTTLECDVHVSADGAAMVTHDRKINAAHCRDTGPAWPGDGDFPYVGKYVTRLHEDQLRTIDCGSLRHPLHPRQRTVPGVTMPTLPELFDLVRDRGADDVQLNIETKFEAVAPTETAPPERFVRVVAAEVQMADVCDRVSVQSFDWALLRRMRQVEPRVRLNALTSSYYLEHGVPGPSPWLAGLDIDDFDGNLVAAAAEIGVDAVSPAHGEPVRMGVDNPQYRPFVTETMVHDAHECGMAVIPWTVDDPPTMHALIDLGVDGIITNYPDVLRDVMADRGMPLPQAYPGALPAQAMAMA